MDALIEKVRRVPEVSESASIGEKKHDIVNRSANTGPTGHPGAGQENRSRSEALRNPLFRIR